MLLRQFINDKNTDVDKNILNYAKLLVYLCNPPQKKLEQSPGETKRKTSTFYGDETIDKFSHNYLKTNILGDILGELFINKNFKTLDSIFMNDPTDESFSSIEEQILSKFKEYPEYQNEARAAYFVMRCYFNRSVIPKDIIKYLERPATVVNLRMIGYSELEASKIAVPEQKIKDVLVEYAQMGDRYADIMLCNYEYHFNCRLQRKPKDDISSLDLAKWNIKKIADLYIPNQYFLAFLNSLNNEGITALQFFDSSARAKIEKSLSEYDIKLSEAFANMELSPGENVYSSLGISFLILEQILFPDTEISPELQEILEHLNDELNEKSLCLLGIDENLANKICMFYRNPSNIYDVLTELSNAVNKNDFSCLKYEYNDDGVLKEINDNFRNFVEQSIKSSHLYIQTLLKCYDRCHRKNR